MEDFDYKEKRFEQDIEDVPGDVLLDSAQMYIVTNKSLHNGAASMLFFKEIKENYEVFQQDLLQVRMLQMIMLCLQIFKE